MSEILTQEEINALFAEFAKTAQGEPQGDSQARASDGGPKEYKVYDFRRPDKFSKDQLRTIQMLYEGFSRRVSSVLSAHLRFPVRVEVEQVSQMLYDEYMAGIKSPAALYVFEPEPWEGTSLLDMGAGLVLAMIDRLLGGSGRYKGKPRELTEIEQALLKSIVVRVLDEFGETWEPFTKLNVRLVSFESNPAFAQIAEPNETVCVTSFEVKMVDTNGTMRLCIPHSALQQVKPRLSARRVFSQEKRAPKGAMGEDVKAKLELVAVPITVTLGTAQVTAGELVDLSVGDVIKLDQRATDRLKVVVGRTPKFLAIPGSSGSKLAVQITDILSSEEA